jgi:RNA polymerase sigma-70 factor, ECF subfamily
LKFSYLYLFFTVDYGPPVFIGIASSQKPFACSKKPAISSIFMVLIDDKTIFRKIRDDDQVAFKSLFDTYYASLCHYASHYLNDDSLSEEVVQELFVKLWEKRKTLEVETSVKHYLFRSVRNGCLNQIQHDKVKQLHGNKLKAALMSEDPTEEYMISPEMILRMEEGIESLPEKRREIFRLSMEEGLKYREIAEKLEISVKTVEAQMGLALKALRSKIRKLMVFFLILRKRKSGKKNPL